jgi:hypothetical protein
MKKIIYLLVILTVSNLNAQENSPYTLDLLKDGIVLSTSGFLYGTPGWFKPDSHTMFLDPQEINALNTNDIISFNRWAVGLYSPELNTASIALSYVSMVGVVGGILAIPGIGEKQDIIYRDAGILSLMYLEGLLFSQGLARISNTYLPRPKPFVYMDELEFFLRSQTNNNNSFFSGRSALSFYNAVFVCMIAREYLAGAEYLPWIYRSTFTIAGAISVFELTSGERFPTDIIIGAAIGGLSAWATVHFHKVSQQNSSLSILPRISNRYTGLACSYRF